MAKVKPKYTLTVDRLDDGKANINLWSIGATVDIVATATRGGWDDAIPWKTGIYNTAVKAGGFSGLPAWSVIENFADREGILVHTALKATAKVPITYGSYGCIVADGTFINKVKSIVKSGPLKVEVRGADPTVGLKLESSTQAVTEGEDFTLNVKMSGDTTGVSKDCYVLVKQTTVAGTANATWNTDYQFDQTGMKSLKGEKNDAIKNNPSKATIKTDFLFVKIKAHSTEAQIKVKTLGDTLIEGDEYATFKIIDYYFDSPNKKGDHRYYSDYLSKDKVLIKNGSDAQETIKISDTPSLDNLSLSQSGGIEGFNQTYHAKTGVSYTWNFEAYGIPDTLKIYDNTGYYAFVDNQSYNWSDAFQLRKGSDGFVHIEVTGSDSGTSWDLNVYSQSPKILKELSVGLQPSGSSNEDHFNIVKGTKGDNILHGTSQRDLFVGGHGHDTFVFDNAPRSGQHDVVRDFKLKSDKIALDHEAFALVAGKLAEENFFVGSKAHDSDDRIIYNSKTGSVLYDADGEGGADPILFAVLSRGLNLSHLDFVIV